MSITLLPTTLPSQITLKFTWDVTRDCSSSVVVARTRAAVCCHWIGVTCRRQRRSEVHILPARFFPLLQIGLVGEIHSITHVLDSCVALQQVRQGILGDLSSDSLFSTALGGERLVTFLHTTQKLLRPLDPAPDIPPEPDP
jgi:hypothetical protein